MAFKTNRTKSTYIKDYMISLRLSHHLRMQLEDIRRSMDMMDYSKTFNVSVLKAMDELNLQIVEPLLKNLLKDYYRLKKLERIVEDD